MAKINKGLSGGMVIALVIVVGALVLIASNHTTLSVSNPINQVSGNTG
jgi:hypothetical protein